MEVIAHETEQKYINRARNGVSATIDERVPKHGRYTDKTEKVVQRNNRTDAGM
jgi:hypothetical protein